MCDLLAIGGRRTHARAYVATSSPVSPEKTDDEESQMPQLVMVLLSLTPPCLLTAAQQAAGAASVVPGTPAWRDGQSGTTRLAG
jgi:hypothetical protein